jgi:hypothetical protein
MAVPYSFFEVYLVVHPKTYHQAGLRSGTATSNSTKTETTSRFGVKLIRNPLGLSERDLLVESCDTANRTLRCGAIARDAIPSDLDVVETTWQWKVIEDTGQPVVMHTCNTACIAGAEGHDLRHGVSGTDDDDNPFGPIYP